MSRWRHRSYDILKFCTAEHTSQPLEVSQKSRFLLLLWWCFQHAHLEEHQNCKLGACRPIKCDSGTPGVAGYGDRDHHSTQQVLRCGAGRHLRPSSSGSPCSPQGTAITIQTWLRDSFRSLVALIVRSQFAVVFESNPHFHFFHFLGCNCRQQQSWRGREWWWVWARVQCWTTKRLVSASPHTDHVITLGFRV